MTYEIWSVVVEVLALTVALVVGLALWARRLRRMAALVALWFAAAFIVSRIGFFGWDPVSGSVPAFASGDLLAFSLLGGAMTLPVLVGVLVWRRSPRVRAILGTVSLRAIVGVQVYRLAGAVFYGMAALRLIPRSLGLITGSADVLVGVGAAVLALGLARSGAHGRGARFAVRAWSVFGIADFLISVSVVSLAIAGVTVGTPDPVLIGERPLALISLFQVPLSILLHLLAIKRIRERHAERDSRTVLVVGATKGIGRATALRLAKLGYTVYGTGRAIGSEGDSIESPIRWLVLDVTDAHSISAAVSRIPGGPEVVINSAGLDLYGSVMDTSIEEFQDQIDVNLTGAARLVRAVVPSMKERGQGIFIQLSSLGGLVALPNNSAYAASKFGVEGYFESLRTELARSNIWVTLVEPGQVSTASLATSLRSAGGTGSAGDRAVRRAIAEGERARLSPERVARVISRAVGDPRPPLRYAVGSQAVMIAGLKRWFGFSALESILRGRA